ncbi:pseudouridine synthase [Saprospiraceae bacterium]|nr:pseudouridine synthase [Saprospiraceae bacterium]
MKKDHEIVFEDDHIVVVNKSAGLLTIPDRYQHDKRNLSSLMIERYGEIFVVHRIDRETSGLIMFAKNSEAHKELSEAFGERKIHKTYLAIVQGTPTPLEGRIETFLVKSETERSKIIVFKKG